MIRIKVLKYKSFRKASFVRFRRTRFFYQYQKGEDLRNVLAGMPSNMRAKIRFKFRYFNPMEHLLTPLGKERDKEKLDPSKALLVEVCKKGRAVDMRKRY